MDQTPSRCRIAQLGWEPDYHEPAVRYPTRYRFPHKAKDPMKHIMREYLPMELEKDERVYGGLDAAVRADMPSKANVRWLEILKAFIPVTNFAEIGAGRCMSMLMNAVPNNELRNGYHVQFVDEIRHTGMQMSLARWYAKNVPDPAGWNLGPQALANSVLTQPGAEHAQPLHGRRPDPVRVHPAGRGRDRVHQRRVRRHCPDVAARNGDFTLPTTYLSVQSDEARHISNGYATLLTVLQDDHNAPLIERDLQQAFWINHAFIDVFSAIVMEYFSRDRSDPECFLDKWDRWVRDDWHRAYIMKLGKLGLDIPPDIFERARERLVAGVHHRHAILMFAAWPFANWRMDPLDERDFEWFESKYPGWYAEYGAFFEAYRHGLYPDARVPAADLINLAPPSCWTCQGFCVSEADRRHRVVDEPRPGSTARQECRWMDESNPGRYTGDRNFFDRYHGWEASEVIRDLGFVRADGETLIGQPHLRGRPPLDARGRAPRTTSSSTARTSGWRGSSGCRAAITRGWRRLPATARCRWTSPRPISPPARRCDEGPPRADRRGDRLRARGDGARRRVPPGLNLVYGCREGQCSACKCFLLEGDVELKRYSNFALSDTERASGYSLMCRAMPEQDLVVELLHYDPDNLPPRAPDPPTAEPTVEAVEALTARHHPARARGRRAGGFDFTPGQYVDLQVPGRRRRRPALVLAGQPPGRRPDRADHQALPGRQALGAARGRDRARRRDRASPARTARCGCATATRRS